MRDAARVLRIDDVILPRAMLREDAGDAGTEAREFAGSRFFMRAELLAGAAFLLLGFAMPALGQTPLWRVTKAAHEAFIEAYARTDPSCQGIEPPAIYLDQPPAHGIVCLRRAGVLLRKVEDGNLVQCLRHKVLGVHVIYLPRGGYTGTDTASYTVQFPGVRHAVRFDVTVEPDAPQSQAAVPPDIGAPVGETPQTSGLIPTCTALVS